MNRILLLAAFVLAAGMMLTNWLKNDHGVSKRFLTYFHILPQSVCVQAIRLRKIAVLGLIGPSSLSTQSNLH